MPATNTIAAAALLANAVTITGINLSRPEQDAATRAVCLKFARADIRLALREGECCIAGTVIGNVFVRRESDKTVSVTYIKDLKFCDQVRVIAEGTVAEVAPIIAGLFAVSAE